MKDALEPEVTPEEFAGHSPAMQEMIERYSYIDERGIRIISWDFGRFVNHCCHCNTMSTGYGFEIAIRDILPGEEITDEYGIFNIEHPIPLLCKYCDCRGMVSKEDFEKYFNAWDEQVIPAIQLVNSVEQPLQAFMDRQTLQDVKDFLLDSARYKSVLSLKYQGRSLCLESAKA